MEKNNPLEKVVDGDSREGAAVDKEEERTMQVSSAMKKGTEISVAEGDEVEREVEGEAEGEDDDDGEREAGAEDGDHVDCEESGEVNDKEMDPYRSADVVIPQSLFPAPNSSSGKAGSWGGECTVLLQVDPSEASRLELDGASGAIGRWEADEEGVTVDLKGFQYRGTIHPGPTVLVASLGGGVRSSLSGGNFLKVDSMTNEFVTLSQLGSTIDRLNAVVEGNDTSSWMAFGGADEEDEVEEGEREEGRGHEEDKKDSGSQSDDGNNDDKKEKRGRPPPKRVKDVTRGVKVRRQRGSNARKTSSSSQAAKKRRKTR